MAQASFLLMLVASFSSSTAEQGFIQRHSDNFFLTCDTRICSWQSKPSQIFRKDPGNNGELRFRILDVDGADTGQCLDREHCHRGSSNARMGSCDHCGAVHWGYDGSRLAEDHMKNCIQSDGNVAHCSQSHEAIAWPVAQDCKPTSTAITDLKCKNPEGDSCGASFEKGSTKGAHSDHDCDACEAAEGSSTECDFNFAVETDKTISTQFQSGTEIMVGTEFDVGVDFLLKAEAKVKISVTEKLTYGQTKTMRSATTVTGGCKATIKAGTKESAQANFFVGTLIGEFTAKVTTKFDCPWKKDKEETTTGTMTITNVPTESMDGYCKTVGETCHKSLDPLFVV